MAITSIAAPLLYGQNCPLGWVSQSLVMTYPYQGRCCSLEVTYCLRFESIALGGSTNTFEFEIQQFQLIDPEECWNLDPGRTPPISASQVYEWARKQIVYQQYQNGGISTCPSELPWSVKETTFQCWAWQFFSISNNIIMGPCGSSTCVRVCTICVNPSIPNQPCLGPASKVVFNCSTNSTQVPCNGVTPPVEGCQAVGCSY
jgi:hypothetical protein